MKGTGWCSLCDLLPRELQGHAGGDLEAFSPEVCGGARLGSSGRRTWTRSHPCACITVSPKGGDEGE